ncbi:hypothetical protein ACT3UQ_08820 [Glutamicibacter sp. AOP12-B1-11]|uniref:hypothetical protein n=1 Tax=Glutamicibacter sp. AOP12-B1-11 TaxID=3457725 RepID=UPI0040339A3F
MSTNELITRARRAIETGQPNLAKLYMRKALGQTDARRRELKPLAWQLRQLGKGLNGMAAAIAGVFSAFEIGIARANELEAAQRKTDYALVGPGK